MDNRMLQAAGIGGAVMGVLSGLPYISACNCILCMWAWVGGGLAAMLYARSARTTITTGDGAKAGAVAGAIGAVIAAVMNSITSLAGGTAAQQQAIDLLRQQGQGGLADQFSQLPAQTAGFDPLGFCFTLVLFLVFLTVFGALGGLLSTTLFGNRPRTAAM